MFPLIAVGVAVLAGAFAATEAIDRSKDPKQSDSDAAKAAKVAAEHPQSYLVTPIEGSAGGADAAVQQAAALQSVRNFIV